MLGGVLVGVLAAAAPVKLAAVGFSSHGLSADAVRFYGEHFAARFSGDERFVVTTPSDMAAVLGLERQRALLGCSTAMSTCMAELAGALGVDGIITGQVARVGDEFQLDVKVIAADGSRVLFSHSSALLHTERALVEELRRIADAARARLSGTVAESEAVPPTSRPWAALVPVLAGAVLAGVGVGLWADAAGKYGQLDDPQRWPAYDLATANQLAGAGQRNQTAGVVLVALAGAAIIAGLVWMIVGRP